MVSMEECESVVNDFLRCLVTHKNDRSSCSKIESVLDTCNTQIFSAKGVPKDTSYCIDELTDYAKCSVNLNTSMCSSEYTRLHECKLKRRRFLLGEDLGLVTMNPQTRKRWYPICFHHLYLFRKLNGSPYFIGCSLGDGKVKM